MTRETKIGLLVGLAFIIVIGILLSDHLSVSAEPPQAALVQAGKSVREGIAVPGATERALPTAAPVNILPQHPVPTRQDLHPPVQRPEAIVSIQTGNRPQQQAPITIQHHGRDATEPSHGNNASAPVYQRLPDDEIVRSITPAPVAPVAIERQPEPDQWQGRQLTDPLARLAQQFGEQVVNADGSDRPVARSQTLEAREYVATAGDSLSKIAARFYGRSTRESRELIINANPSLKENPNLILAGRTYLIPQKGLTVTPAPVAIHPTPRPAASESYTVKEGDTLWKIAKDQCGSVRELQAIRDLNRDVLKGNDTVIVGMTLRLPNKTVVSVQ